MLLMDNIDSYDYNIMFFGEEGHHNIIIIIIIIDHNIPLSLIRERVERS